MEQLGPIAAMLVFAYAFGGVWYHVLDHTPSHWLRAVSYPLMGIVLGEGLWASYLPSGPGVLGVHVVIALFATLIMVSLDVMVESRKMPFSLRHIQHWAANGGWSMPRLKIERRSAVRSRAGQDQ